MLELKKIVGNDSRGLAKQIKLFKDSIPPKQLYSRLQSFIIACMYVCSPQGRPEAINFLNLEDGNTLLKKDGIVLSEKFKTAKNLQ
jgi:hypothetical protein